MRRGRQSVGSYFMTFTKIRGFQKACFWIDVLLAVGGMLSPGQPPELGVRRAGHLSNPQHLIMNAVLVAIVILVSVVS